MNEEKRGTSPACLSFIVYRSAFSVSPMRPLAAIFSLLVAAAGWHYVFYSRAAHRLEGVEEERLNRVRIGLRRVGGVVMLCLAASFLAMFFAYDLEHFDRATPTFLVLLLSVFGLLGLIVVLALIDLRLTVKLRRRFRARRFGPQKRE